jgi:hypothetical protein
LYGAETWTVQKLNLKYLERSEMCCWTRMEKISWTYYVKNADVFNRFKVERNILHTVKGRKVNGIGHILERNCLLKQVTEGNI